VEFDRLPFQIVETTSTGSTNADLAAAAREGAPEGTVHVTDHQVGGRGRLDREWIAPAGSGLAVSVLLRPADVPLDRWGWIPLLTGVAVADAVAQFGVTPRLKWPNDVEVGSRKLAGILVELVSTSDGPAAVVGVGLNVTMTSEQLPVPTATSLALEGVDADRREVLDALLAQLESRYGAWRTALGQADEQSSDGLWAAYTERCSSVGAEVHVTMPDGSIEEGVVTGIDGDGRLVLDGRAISAGDVVHVRNSRS
jgi:BirA family biotin operon repressor/biotin-[acetyl-CoA-carboxylase] ligase